jgi:hypothetical protein
MLSSREQYWREDDSVLYWKLQSYNIKGKRHSNASFLVLLNWFDMNGLSVNAKKLEAVDIAISVRIRHEESMEGLNLADVHIPVSDSVE